MIPAPPQFSPFGQAATERHIIADFQVGGALASPEVRRFGNLRYLVGCGFAGLALVGLTCFGAVAEPIRVATWTLSATGETAIRTKPSNTAGGELRQAAAALRRLNPEVILLQQSSGWQSCVDLAEALKPAQYYVLACSAFPDLATGKPAPSQAAILSKSKGYFSWCEPWRAKDGASLSGGFAFAAIQFGNQRLGFFTVQRDDHLPEAELKAQWVGAVGSFKTWVTNRLTAAVVGGGDFSGEGGWSRVPGLLGAALAEPVLISAQPDNSVASAAVPVSAEPAALPGLVLEGYRVACDLSVTPGRPAAAVAAASDTRPREQARILSPPASAGAETQQPGPSAGAATSAAGKPRWQAQPRFPARWLWVGGAVLAALVWLVLAWRKSGRGRAPTRLPALGESDSGVASYSMVITPQSVTGSGTENPLMASSSQAVIRVEPPQAPAGTLPTSVGRGGIERPAGLAWQVSQWLKEKFVRRLIADRAGLLKTQEVATLKLLSVEQRVARIESQLREQNRAYEERIDELTRDLMAAREENRELIRARIAQVKAEMAAARAKLMAQAEAEE